MNNLLETNNLTKTFKFNPVVKGIDLKVPQGCVYGLLGPNGAGKSTTLKMLTGMMKPTKGTIYFDGHPWSRRDLFEIGALIENPPVYDNLTAYENMAVRAAMMKVPAQRIDTVLEMVKLTDTGRKRTGQFSMGMRQRLGIALALLTKPKLLILDEPANGLDPVGILDLRKLIRTLADHGITVLLSSHQLSEVQMMADVIGIITEGTLRYQKPVVSGQNLEKLFMDCVRGGALDAVSAAG